jgi:3'(2'), 5'-bisphosphate nucleotidase
MGGPLKMCRVAEGQADLYPRFGPTMEWDTAAPHAVLLGAGKTIRLVGTGEELRYNKEDLTNGSFIAG